MISLFALARLLAEPSDRRCGLLAHLGIGGQFYNLLEFQNSFAFFLLRGEHPGEAPVRVRVIGSGL